MADSTGGNVHRNRTDLNAAGVAEAERSGDVLIPDGFRQSTASLLLSTLAINLLSLALPVMTLQVYDRILPNQGSGTLPVLIAGVCVAIALETLLRLSRAYVIGRAGVAYEHRMACRVMDRVLHADLLQMQHYGVGGYLHRMAAIGKLKDFYDGYALTTLAELCFVPLFLALILYIAGPLVLVPALVLGAFILVSLWSVTRLRRALKRREEADDARFNFLIESLEGVHTLKAFALERFFERRYETLEERSTRANYEVTQETAATFNGGSVFSHVMVAGVISVGAWCVLEGMLTAGALIATLLLSGRIMQPVQKALALWARYQDYVLARRHVEELMAMPQVSAASHGMVQGTAPEGRLSLRHVGFGFGQGGRLLEDVNLELERGTTMLLSGAHGSGKTTLLSLIAGIYPLQEGELIVDGMPIAHYQPEELARHVGYIRARSLMFRGTIRDNITCFGQTDEAQAREVAAMLGIDKEIARLPGGFDTFLSGHEGDSITPGLKQRISMTRVLAAKPHIILFDSADRALDREGYTMIYSLLARLKNKVAMVIVSDDRNLRGLADIHYELHEGRLHEAGMDFSTGNVRPFREVRL